MFSLFRTRELYKGFPKPFSNVIIFRNNGYPLYRRPDNGRVVFRKGSVLDNRFVIPYNPILCRRFNAHINVEICESIKAVKYIYKYIYKGPDCLSSELIDENNEIKKYLEGRFITATEAAYRLLGFSLHQESSNVISLPIHLENSQNVLFNEDKPLEEQPDKARDTKLTAWLNLNKTDASAKTLLYEEIPRKYIWHNPSKSWKLRTRQAESTIGRLVSINPSAGELYYLRILLTKIRGPTTFDDIKSFKGEILPSYLEACLANGFLQDNQAAKDTFTEISNCLTNPIQIFFTFADFVIHANLHGADNFYKSVVNILLDHEEVLRIKKRVPPNVHLYYIKNRIEDQGRDYEDYDLPPFPRELTLYDPTVQNFNPNLFGAAEKPYNREQFNFFSHATKSSHNVFFLDGPGGTGKTYLLKGICAYFHRRKQKVLVCASSGIAATLYPTGKTAHSLLKLPIYCDAFSTLGISKGTKSHEELKDAKLLIFDEVTMASKYILDCIDRSLRDLLDGTKPFGGLKVIFAGDFRQLLPVIKRSSQSQIVTMCCTYANVWKHVKTYRLKTNMRTKDKKWANFILKVGNASANDSDGFITLPNTCKIVDDVQSLIDAVFHGKYLEHNYDGRECILAPTNKLCDEVNNLINDNLIQEEKTYISIDEMESNDQIPLEYLNSLKVGGMPNHILILKVGTIVMCLRNINDMLTNGTRLRITKLQKAFVIGEIITEGPNQGKEAVVFMVKLISCETDFPFTFSRTQLPLRISYAMTIHKCQCQTFRTVGILLDDINQCFAHGQLYVALSRASRGASGIISLRRRVKNIVYKNVLQ